MNKFCKKCNVESGRYADGRCKQCTLARHAQWAAQNRDKRNASSRKWNASNDEKKRDLNAQYRRTNQQTINEIRKQRRMQNPDIERAKAALRRARKAGGGGVLTANIVPHLLDRQNGLCACCNTPLEGNYHLDHIMPLSLGGTNTDANVQLLLPRCNLQKHKSTPEKFLARRQKERLQQSYTCDKLLLPRQTGVSDSPSLGADDMQTDTPHLHVRT